MIRSWRRISKLKCDSQKMKCDNSYRLRSASTSPNLQYRKLSFLIFLALIFIFHRCQNASNHEYQEKQSKEKCYYINTLPTSGGIFPDFFPLYREFQFSSVQSLRGVQLVMTPWTTACKASLSTPGAYSNSCPSSWWCHPTISSSVIPFSSCLQSFPASQSLPMSQFFASGGQRIGVSASASVLPMNIQDWFPLGWTGWISL